MLNVAVSGAMTTCITTVERRVRYHVSSLHSHRILLLLMVCCIGVVMDDRHM